MFIQLGGRVYSYYIELYLEVIDTRVLLILKESR